jgi:hypothetical protein
MYCPLLLSLRSILVTYDDSASAVLQVISVEKIVVVERFLMNVAFIVSFYGGMIWMEFNLMMQT